MARTHDTGEPLLRAGAFAGAATRYWTDVFARTRAERARWSRRAEAIPDRRLRALARRALAKHGNLEGAAAFATFAPRPHRATLVRALVSWQAAYDYLDELAEQPSADPVAGARTLHRALLDALDPGARPHSGARHGPSGRLGHSRPPAPEPRHNPHRPPDYYARYPRGEDGGYLTALRDACREALATLPAYDTVAPSVRRAAERIVEFQSLNHAEHPSEHHALARWARAQTPAGEEIAWWETAAAAGSSLGVHALIAAAAEPGLPSADVHALEHAYFPWIGALHSLLDQLVDRPQDAARGQRNLIDRYAGGPAHAAERMTALAQHAALCARTLPHARRHTILLAGMAGLYLSDPAARAPHAQPIAGPVGRALDAELAPLLSSTLLVFRARRAGGGLRGAARAHGEFSREQPRVIPGGGAPAFPPSPRAASA